MAKVFGVVQRQYYDGLTRGHYSYISVHTYKFSKRGRDEIQTGKIVLMQELLNLKHKTVYTVKTTSVHV